MIVSGKGLGLLIGNCEFPPQKIEYHGKRQNASQLITSIRNTLGLSLLSLLEENKKLGHLNE